jgi:hypothetical protein
MLVVLLLAFFITFPESILVMLMITFLLVEVLVMAVGSVVVVIANVLSPLARAMNMKKGPDQGSKQGAKAPNDLSRKEKK